MLARVVQCLFGSMKLAGLLHFLVTALLPHPPAIDTDSDALFLDFDGTLVDFALRPEDVEVPPGLVDALAQSHQRLGGALALISGRALASVDSLLGTLRLPAAGVHGLELRRETTIESNDEEARHLEPARRVIRAQISEGDPIRVEDKGGAIVLHFRGAEAQEDRAWQIAEQAAATDEGLVPVKGHAIAEVRPRAVTKAGAILRLMEAAPFAGRRPIFAGDDVTDEDGFRAAQAAGGYGVKVGSPEHPGGGVTDAHYGLPDVPALRSWLYQLAKEQR
jgi:trehalose 6-phosphate phosphatase